MTIVDCHVHCGIADHSAPQAYEDIAPYFDEAGVNAAVCFSPVMEIYDRYNPDFVDSEEWQKRRENSRRYLCNLRGRHHCIYPFHFVWNDFDSSGLDNYCGIKWHRHQNEPKYNYDDPRCLKMIATIRDLGFVVLLEEEYDNMIRFVDGIGKGLPIIIPHLGNLNGGIEKLFEEDFWKRENTYTDISGGADVSEENIRKFLDRYGPHRLLFGSDYPFETPLVSKRKILNQVLPDADQKLIFSENIMRLLRNVEKYE